MYHIICVCVCYCYSLNMVCMPPKVHMLESGPELLGSGGNFERYGLGGGQKPSGVTPR